MKSDTKEHHHSQEEGATMSIQEPQVMKVPSMKRDTTLRRRFVSARQSLSEAHFEAQRPGLESRDCTESLPQKPCISNPRNRTLFFRNR